MTNNERSIALHLLEGLHMLGLSGHEAEAIWAGESSLGTLTINAPNGDKLVCHGTALDMKTLGTMVHNAAKNAAELERLRAVLLNPEKDV